MVLTIHYKNNCLNRRKPFVRNICFSWVHDQVNIKPYTNYNTEHFIPGILQFEQVKTEGSVLVSALLINSVTKLKNCKIQQEKIYKTCGLKLQYKEISQPRNGSFIFLIPVSMYMYSQSLLMACLLKVQNRTNAINEITEAMPVHYYKC